MDGLHIFNLGNYSSLRLSAKEQISPLLVLDEIYHTQKAFPMWRRDIYIWLKGIFSPGPVWTGKSPAEMLYDMEQLERLIEASWFLNFIEPKPASVSEISEELIVPLNASSNVLMSYWKWDFYPRWLNEKEMKQPYFVLDSFFIFHDLNLWRQILYEWFKRCLSNNSNEDLNGWDTLENFEQLNKLIEATHLIYIREWNMNPDKNDVLEEPLVKYLDLVQNLN